MALRSSAMLSGAAEKPNLLRRDAYDVGYVVVPDISNDLNVFIFKISWTA
jgi:hypothetical protein